MSTVPAAEDFSWDFAEDPSQDDYERTDEHVEVYEQLMKDGTFLEPVFSP